MDILPNIQGWFSRHVDKEVANDRLKLADRLGQIFVIMGTVAVVVLLAYLQTHLTIGFFTPQFGTLETVLFYGMLVFGVAPATLKLVTGSRNRTRPWEMVESIFFFIGGLYLLMVFPFDFSVLANALPENMRYIIDWLSNDEARILWALGVFISLAVANYLFWMHRSVKRRMEDRYQNALQARETGPSA